MQCDDSVGHSLVNVAAALSALVLCSVTSCDQLVTPDRVGISVVCHASRRNFSIDLLQSTHVVDLCQNEFVGNGAMCSRT